MDKYLGFTFAKHITAMSELPNGSLNNNRRDFLGVNGASSVLLGIPSATFSQNNGVQYGLCS